MEAARRDRRHEAHPRGAIDEAWCRPQPCPDGLALGGRQSAQGQHDVELSAQTRQAAASPSARGPISPAHQSYRERSSAAVELYLKLVAIEEAFKNLKGDLAIRPIFHQDEPRVEAHIFIAFLAYCLHVTLRRRLHALAPGLTPRSVLEKFAAIQMIDVHIPTTDGRELVLTRYTEAEPEQKLLLDKLRLELPAQPPPKVTAEPPRP